MAKKNYSKTTYIKEEPSVVFNRHIIGNESLEKMLIEACSEVLYELPEKPYDFFGYNLVKVYEKAHNGGNQKILLFAVLDMNRAADDLTVRSMLGVVANCQNETVIGIELATIDQLTERGKELLTWRAIEILHNKEV